MNNTYGNDNEDLRACFAGGSLADPFLPTQLRAAAPGLLNLDADSSDGELRAAAEHYAAATGENPADVLARLQDSQWELRGFTDPYPDLPAPVLTVTPWSEDLDLWETVAELEAAYPGVDRDVLAGMLRDLRWHLREAVTAEAATRTGDQIVVRSVLDNGVGELITHATTDAEIAAYVVAAEAGSGGPLPGLREELIRLRDAEHIEWRRLVDAAKERLLIDEAKARFEAEEFGDEDTGRVFVGGRPGDPVRVCIPDPVTGKAVPVSAAGSVPRIANLHEEFDEDFVQPGEAGCRFAYRN